MDYTVVLYELDGGQWSAWIAGRRVGDEFERAWFTGPDAEQRAREYAAWKNAALTKEATHDNAE